MNYNAELNYKIDTIMDTHTSEILDRQWTLYENYELLTVKKTFNNSIIAFKGQAENIITNEIKKSINLYVIPNEDIDCDITMDEIWDMCSNEEHLFSKGFARK